MGIKWYNYYVGIRDDNMLVFKCTRCGNITNTLCDDLCSNCYSNNKEVEKLMKEIDKCIAKTSTSSKVKKAKKKRTHKTRKAKRTG